MTLETHNTHMTLIAIDNHTIIGISLTYNVQLLTQAFMSKEISEMVSHFILRWNGRRPVPCIWLAYQSSTLLNQTDCYFWFDGNVSFYFALYLAVFYNPLWEPAWTKSTCLHKVSLGRHRQPLLSVYSVIISVQHSHKKLLVKFCCWYFDT